MGAFLSSHLSPFCLYFLSFLPSFSRSPFLGLLSISSTALQARERGKEEGREGKNGSYQLQKQKCFERLRQGFSICLSHTICLSLSICLCI